ncbi:MAG: helix-turn-helix transcriptional regulator [Bacteroidaceae bacterium]|nr:helix-turn-helix transcriptional regulator [Bacteroidaceae bacterium]
MCDILTEDYQLLLMLGRFGLPLGFGEKTVQEVCQEGGVDTDTFLAVANFNTGGADAAQPFRDRLSVRTLIAYLENTHTYFLDFLLPQIRRKLLAAIDCGGESKVSFLILRFFDEYQAEVRRHMAYENDKTFPYVRALLEGRRQEGYSIEVYSRGHDAVERKLGELKNIIIKYYQGGGDANQLLSALFDIFNCEADLHQHEQMEDHLFIPAVELLEEKVAVGAGEAVPDTPQAKEETLSEREKDIVRCIVRGMTNKEVAEELFISVNTVLTHRKNIARKLSIHSVAGLTIYAIAGGLVNLDEVRL